MRKSESLLLVVAVTRILLVYHVAVTRILLVYHVAVATTPSTLPKCSIEIKPTSEPALGSLLLTDGDLLWIVHV